DVDDPGWQGRAPCLRAGLEVKDAECVAGALVDDDRRVVPGSVGNHRDDVVFLVDETSVGRVRMVGVDLDQAYELAVQAGQGEQAFARPGDVRDEQRATKQRPRLHLRRNKIGAVSIAV